MYAVFYLEFEGRTYKNRSEIKFAPEVGMQIVTASARTLVTLASYDLDGGFWYVSLYLKPDNDLIRHVFLRWLREAEWEEQDS